MGTFEAGARDPTPGINNCDILLYIAPAVNTLSYNIRNHTFIDDDEYYEELFRVVKDFILRMIAESTTYNDYKQYIVESLQEYGYTHYPLTQLVDMLHANLYNLLEQSIPCPMDKVLAIKYLGYSFNGRIALEVIYAS